MHILQRIALFYHIRLRDMADLSHAAGSLESSSEKIKPGQRFARYPGGEIHGWFIQYLLVNLVFDKTVFLGQDQVVTMANEDHTDQCYGEGNNRVDKQYRIVIGQVTDPTEENRAGNRG